MKRVIIAVVSLLALNVFSQEMPYGYSKLIACAEVSHAAGYAFELKDAKKKLVYPKVDDVIFAAFVKKAMDTGYKAKSFEIAIQKGFNECMSSKIWNETSLKFED